MSQNSERHRPAHGPKHRDVDCLFAETVFDGTKLPLVVVHLKDHDILYGSARLFTLREADRLDIVTVRVQHECAVVGRTVMRTQTGPPLSRPPAFIAAS